MVKLISSFNELKIFNRKHQSKMFKFEHVVFFISCKCLTQEIGNLKELSQQNSGNPHECR